MFTLHQFNPIELIHWLTERKQNIELLKIIAMIML